MSGEDFSYRLGVLEEKLEKMDNQNQKTHKEFFDRFEQMGKEYTRIDTQYANILATLAKVEVSIEELKSRPAKRWEAVVAAIISGAVAFLVGYIF